MVDSKKKKTKRKFTQKALKEIEKSASKGMPVGSRTVIELIKELKLAYKNSK